MTAEELRLKVSDYDCCTLWVETQKDGEYVKECAYISTDYEKNRRSLAILTERYSKAENARLRIINREGATRYEMRKGIFIGTGREGLE